MLVRGASDPTVPYERSSQEFGLAPRQVLRDARRGRADPIQPSAGGCATKSMIDFFDRYLKDELDTLPRLQTDADMAGVASLQADAPGA